MGRRPKYSRDGTFTRLAAASGASSESADERPDDVPRESPGLEGWPPSYYCYACHNIRWGAQDIRADFCEQCNAFLAELELAYVRAMSAAAKALPEARHGAGGMEGVATPDREDPAAD